VQHLHDTGLLLEQCVAGRVISLTRELACAGKERMAAAAPPDASEEWNL
jgi:hypothetical protein